MCFKATPKLQKPPEPVKPPPAPNPVGKVSRKPKKVIKAGGEESRRGTQRAALVVPPSGVNRGQGGTGVYS